MTYFLRSNKKNSKARRVKKVFDKINTINYDMKKGGIDMDNLSEALTSISLNSNNVRKIQRIMRKAKKLNETDIILQQFPRRSRRICKNMIKKLKI